MKIRKLTSATERKIFAARAARDMKAERVAAEIVADVRKRGDKALFEWTEKLDGIDLIAEGVWIGEKEIRSARRAADKELVQAIEHAVRNVRRVAQQQLPKAWSIETDRGVRISQRVEPIERIGCYIPGGSFALVSTLSMTVVPAQVAGGKEIVVAWPGADEGVVGAAGGFGGERKGRHWGGRGLSGLGAME